MDRSADISALTPALDIARLHDGEVVAVGLGGRRVEQALLECLALGASRAVWVPASEGPLHDTLSDARVLARVLNDEAGQLVLARGEGPRCDGTLGSAVAGFLALPFATEASEVYLDPSGPSMMIGCHSAERGQDLRFPTPGLVTVVVNEQPRNVSLAALKSAERQGVEKVDIAASDLDEAALDLLRSSSTGPLSVSQKRRTAQPVAEGSLATAAALRNLMEELS